MLSERSQTPKMTSDSTYMKFWKTQTIVTETRLATAWPKVQEVTKGRKKTFWGEEIVLYVDCGGGYP